MMHLRYRWQRLGVSRKLMLIGSLIVLSYLVFLDIQLQLHFSGARWELPSRVYARPLELYSGKDISLRAVERELRAIGYRPVEQISGEAQYTRKGAILEIQTRSFRFPDGEEPAQRISVAFRGGQVTRVELRKENDGQIGLLRLEPMFVGAIYPQRKEDRILLKLEDVPPLLVELLLAVEDRDFYQHLGIKPSAIARALLVNLKAGRAAQGGSTITQQLVKNLYLSNEKTLWRKVREAVLSLMLEFHFDKNEILEAYLNEVYLGQDGARAIHGFGMASYFYFSKPLAALTPSQLMLLVGMVKGPSAYDPVRHPIRTRKRWQTVYNIATEKALLAHSETHQFPAVSKTRQTRNRFPHFIQFVKRQLSREYDESDLQSAGLQIFTSLDPQIQWEAESITRDQIGHLQNKVSTELQSAMILSSRHTGEVLAYKGGNEQYTEGFNRAIDARRQVGSLLKPAIYLAALEQPEQYNMATMLDDSELTVELDSGKVWQPQNYDRQFHGNIPLYEALADSYNIAAVRLGMAIGVERVVETVRRLGVDTDIKPYPSMLLGAVELSPLEVLKMYQTIANSGYYTPLKVIRYVTGPDGELLNRYPLDLERRVDSVSNFLISGLMTRVTRSGTAKSAYAWLNNRMDVAGKTGTTDQLRDSWFAGFSQNYVLVNWVGNDHNESVNLTGSSGALRLWAQLISRVETESLNIAIPEGVGTGFVDVMAETQNRDVSCKQAVEIPFHQDYPPAGIMQCDTLPQRLMNNTRKWIKQWF